MKKIDLVCIVDDDPMHVFITKKYIELSNHVKKIIVCSDGKDAFDTLTKLNDNNQNLPQIIFLDLNMPIWTGWDFLEEFSKTTIHKQITIYIITSSNDEADFIKAKKYGLSDNFLIKPVVQSELNEVLADFIDDNNL